MQEKYFNELEKKEQLEDKLKTITEIKVKVVCCKQVRQLQRALLLGNLEGRFLNIHDPFKFKAVFVTKMFRYLSLSVLNFYSK